MKKIIGAVLAVCILLSTGVCLADDGILKIGEVRATIGTNSTHEKKAVGNYGYYLQLFDGKISTSEKKLTEIYAQYSIYPARAESAWVNIDLGSAYEISGVRVYGRYEYNTQIVSKGNLYFSEDGKTWIKTDTQSFSKDARYADFKAVFGKKQYNVKARYLKIEATEVGENITCQHWGMEEIQFLAPVSGNDGKKISELSSYTVKDKKVPGANDSYGDSAIKTASLEAATAASSSGSSEKQSSEVKLGAADTVKIEGASATIESNSTHEKKAVGNYGYYLQLFDGKISTSGNKLSEIFAQYSIYPDKAESAWVNIDLGSAYEISGARVYGRFEYNTQVVSKGYIHISEDGQNWYRSDEQSFSKDARYADFKTLFGKKIYKVKVRYLKIEAIEVGESKSNPHWGMEEIEFLAPSASDTKAKISDLAAFKWDEKKAEAERNAIINKDKTDATGKYILLKGKDKWTVSASSYYSESDSAKAAFDDNDNTYWHTKYVAENGAVISKDPPPYEVDITFDQKTVISGFVYKPRKSLGGTITGIEIYGSESDTGELRFITAAEMTADISQKAIEFYANLTVKRIKLKVIQSLDGVATAAEFDFIARRNTLPASGIEDYPKIEEQFKLYEIDTSLFSARSDIPIWAGHDVSSMLDGGINSFWQTDRNALPASFDIDMRAEHEISRIECVPRQSQDLHGNWKAFEIWAGDSKDKLEKVYEMSDSVQSLDKKVIDFEKAVRAKYLRFIITEAKDDRASCAELYFYQSKQAMDREKAAAYEKYVLKIGEKNISVTKGDKTHVRELDTAPYIYESEGTTLIPLRGLIEEMGGSVEWNGENQEINITTLKGKIEMQVQRITVMAEHPNYGMIRYTLRVAPKIKDSRTFIPLRFVSENLGYSVEWIPEGQEIVIEKK